MRIDCQNATSSDRCLRKLRLRGQTKLDLNPQRATVWWLATELALTSEIPLPHLGSGGSHRTGRGIARRKRPPARRACGCFASASFPLSAPQSPLQQCPSRPPDRAVPPVPAGPQPPLPDLACAPREEKLCCFGGYTLSSRREAGKLLFLFLRCRICQRGAVDRRPLCRRTGSFNCLSCVTASVHVCVCDR